MVNKVINSFEPNGDSHSYQLDQCVSGLRIVGLKHMIFDKALIIVSEYDQEIP